MAETAAGSTELEATREATQMESEERMVHSPPAADEAAAAMLYTEELALAVVHGKMDAFAKAPVENMSEGVAAVAGDGAGESAGTVGGEHVWLVLVQHRCACV